MGHKSASQTPAHHGVLRRGDEVEFKNPNGKGSIAFVSDFERRIRIDGAIYHVTLSQRSKEFRHQQGLYNPGYPSARPQEITMQPHRVVMEESELNFDSKEECEAFFKEGANYLKWVGNNDGIALGFMTTPARDQINLSLYRTYINGNLMTTIPKQYRHPGNVITSSE